MFPQTGLAGFHRLSGQPGSSPILRAARVLWREPVWGCVGVERCGGVSRERSGKPVCGTPEQSGRLWDQPVRANLPLSVRKRGIWSLVCGQQWGSVESRAVCFYQTPTANMEKKWKVSARICTQPALPFGSSGHLLCIL